jgi:DmsE family decaheme c-type cytochrome
MLNAESVNETCFPCHAEKEGPFTFDHPPASENCTICHNPHGSVQNYLLVQSLPFLCLKCHAGPHSRPVSVPGVPAPGIPALASPATLSQYYTQCTDCHSQPHGSDEHGALHY